MNKTDSNHPEMLVSLPPPPVADFSTGPGRRLIALIPAAELDDAELARRIGDLAATLESPVLLLGLYQHTSDEALLRRQMVTIAAVLRSHKINVKVRVEPGRDWVAAVRAVVRPGDSIACITEQEAGLPRRPLSLILSSGLGSSVHVLSLPGPVAPVPPRKSLLAEIVAWGGVIGIVLGFFWLQVQIEQLPKDWAHGALLYLSIIVEIALIWAWNSLFA